MALLEAAVQGIEIEAFNKMIPDLVFSGKTLKNRIKKATKAYDTANVTFAGGQTRQHSVSRCMFSRADLDLREQVTATQWVAVLVPSGMQETCLQYSFMKA